MTVIYVISGVTRYVDQSGGQTEAPAGSLVHRLPGVPHETRVQTRPTYGECWLLIPTVLHDLVLGMFGLKTCPPVMRAPFHPGFVEQYAALADLLETCPEGHLPRALVRAQELVTDLYLHALRPVKPEFDVMMERACRILGARLEERTGINQLLADLPIGYERFRKLFRERMGVSPGEYRVERRLERAEQLLECPDYSVKEIAFMLGYGDVSAFSNQFRTSRGYSPLAYRNSRMGHDGSV